MFGELVGVAACLPQRDSDRAQYGIGCLIGEKLTCFCQRRSEAVDEQRAGPDAKHPDLVAITERNFQRTMQVFARAVLVFGVIDARFEDAPIEPHSGIGALHVERRFDCGPDGIMR